MTATRSPAAENAENDVQQLERLVAAITQLKAQVARRIVGQEDVV